MASLLGELLVCITLFTRIKMDSFDICDADTQVDALFFDRYSESNVYIVTKDRYYEFNLERKTIESSGMISAHWHGVPKTVSYAMSDLVKSNGNELMQVIFGTLIQYMVYICNKTMNCKQIKKGSTDQVITQHKGMDPLAGYVQQKRVYDDNGTLFLFTIRDPGSIQCNYSRKNLHKESLFTKSNCVLIKRPNISHLLEKPEDLLAITSKWNRKTNKPDFVLFDQDTMRYTWNGTEVVLLTKTEVFQCPFLPWVFWVTGIGFVLLLISLACNIFGHLLYGETRQKRQYRKGRVDITATTATSRTNIVGARTSLMSKI